MQEYIEEMVLEDHQIQVLGDPPLPPQVHVCFSFFEKVIFLLCSICLILFVFADIDICYFMKESIEAMVLEEHQIQVLGDPPLPPPRYMYVSLSLKTSFFIHVVYVSFSFYYLTFTYVTLCRLLMR